MRRNKAVTEVDTWCDRKRIRIRTRIGGGGELRVRRSDARHEKCFSGEQTSAVRGEEKQTCSSQQLEASGTICSVSCRRGSALNLNHGRAMRTSCVSSLPSRQGASDRESHAGWRKQKLLTAGNR